MGDNAHYDNLNCDPTLPYTGKITSKRGRIVKFKIIRICINGKIEEKRYKG